MPTLNWVFTLHNYDDQDITWFDNYDFQYIVYGKEVCPSTGRRHLQGYFQLKKPAKILSFAPFKNTPDCDEDATPLRRSKWFRPAKGTDEEASKYCKKEGDFTERGERKAHKGQGHRSDLEELQKAIASGMSYDEICEAFFETAAKYHRFIQERISARDSQLVKEQQRAILSDIALRPWQQTVVTHLEEDPHPRHVNWLWETVGDVGKTTLANYLELEKDALVLEVGGKRDLAYIISTMIGMKKVVVFDLSRCTAPDGNKDYDPLNALYSIMESLKNGRLIVTKYESTVRKCIVPHIWVFANFPPNIAKMSKDRWKLWSIKDNELEAQDIDTVNWEGQFNSV